MPRIPDPHPGVPRRPRTAPKPGRSVPVPPRPRPTAADLHVHTTHSDGVCSPCEVVIAAGCVGLAALAIPDHDTLPALAAAPPEAARRGTPILVHSAGAAAPALRAATAALRAARAERLRAMAGRLESLGLRV